LPPAVEPPYASYADATFSRFTPGAFTAVWDPTDAPWSAAVRTEFLHDPDGLTTGLRQTVWAATVPSSTV